MTGPLAYARHYGGPPPAAVYPSTTPRTPTGVGPRSRVIVTGSWAHQPAIWAALTTAWRDAGQPLLVVHTGRSRGVDAVARGWVAEHEFAGHTEHLLDGPDLDDTWRVLAFLDAQWRECGLMLAAQAAGLDVWRWEA